MSTIAYRDGILAADTGEWVDNSVHRWARKIAAAPPRSFHRFSSCLFGVVGSAPECAAFLDWAENTTDPNSMPMPRRIGDYDSSFKALLVYPDGLLRVLSADGWQSYPSRPPYFAIGAGAPTALGALFAGADAATAIAAAIEHGEGAFGDVATISFPGQTP